MIFIILWLGKLRLRESKITQCVCVSGGAHYLEASFLILLLSGSGGGSLRLCCLHRPAQAPLTQRVSVYDAVLHLPVGARVPVVGQEGPHSGPWLALGDIKWPLIVSGEGGHVVIDVIHVHKHLRGWTLLVRADPRQPCAGPRSLVWKLHPITLPHGADGRIIWGNGCEGLLRCARVSYCRC